MVDLTFTQQEIISILFSKNTYINKRSISAEDLDYPYSRFLGLFIESMKRFNVVNTDWVLKKLDSGEQQVFLHSVSNMVSNNFMHYVSLEKIMQERTIQRQMDNYINAYKSERISLDELRDKLTIDNKNLVELVTYEDLTSTLEKETRDVHFVGYPRFRATLNLKETDLCIIAAYTGRGKTAFALNLIEDLSRNYEVYYINLEMGIASLRRRIISIHTGIPITKLETFKLLPKKNQEEIKEKAKFINNRKIYVSNGSKSINDLRELIASRGNEHAIFVIDHIGLLNAEGRSLYEKMTNIAKELRKLCLDYNVTIIALSQLSRKGAEGKPDLSMLRDSGEVEQSATKVVFIYNKKYPDGSEDYFLEVAKNRDGLTGNIKVKFDKLTQRIEEI